MLPVSAAALEDQFQHKLAAVEGQHQECAASEGPTAGGDAPPAFGVTTNQERHKHKQGQDQEQGLVGEILGKEILYKRAPVTMARISMTTPAQTISNSSDSMV